MTALKAYQGGAWSVAGVGQIGPQPTKAAWIEYQSGYWYSAVGEMSTTTLTTNNRCYFLPIRVNTATTFDRISCLTSATFSGTSTWRLGIYSPKTDGRPYNVVLDAGTVSCTAASTSYEITINQTLQPGNYFIAGAVQSLATTTNMVTIAGPTRSNWNAPFTAATGNGVCAGFYIDGMSSSLAPAGNTLALTTVPSLRIREA